MSVRTDTVNLIVNVNGNTAQNNLNELRKRAADLTYEMKNNLKRGTQEYIAAAADLKKVNADMSTLRQSIGITSLSQKELTAELSKMKALRGSMTPFTAEFRAMDSQIKAVESRLFDVRNGVTGLSSVFLRFQNQIKTLGTFAVGYLGFQFITSQFQSIIKGSGKLSDQLADLRRVAGLTADEASRLDKSLRQLDTRTANGALRDIAITAGKLGVAKDDILGFTEAVDKLVVSLGDELGDADQITTQLGKILNVFDGKITGDNITKLGNAFVELANTGASTGGFIADFDQRLSGIAKSAGIGLGALSGLGAGLEELGGRVESSATALQKLIVSIAADIPKAAKIAGESTEEFDKLFKMDPTEAILRYSEGLVKNKESFAEVTASLKDAGEEGARTIETISKLGSSADYLRGRIDLGKKSINENSAITDAFALKNENLGAIIDKLGKDFNRLMTSNAVIDFLKGAIIGARDFVKWMKDIPKTIDENKGAFYALVAAVLIYNIAIIKSAIVTAALKLETIGNAIATRAAAIATALAETAQASYITITSLLTGKIKLATAAQRLWNITMALGAGAVGIIIVAAVALVKILGSVFDSNSKLLIQQRAQSDLSRQAAQSYGDQVNKLELLKRAMEDGNSSFETKKKAYQELIAINPEFAKTLKLDIDGHLQGAEAIDIFVAALKKKGEVEAAQNLSNEKNQEILRLQQERFERELKPDRGSIAMEFDLGKIDKKINELKTAKEFFDQKIIGALGSSKSFEFVQPADTGANGTGSDAATVAARKAFLENKIKELEVSYQLLNATDRRGQQTNLAQQKKYQAELDALMGKEEKKTPAQKKANTEHDRLKKEAAEFYKALQKLKEQAVIADQSQDEKDLLALQQKYDELHDKALKYFKKNVTDRKTYTAEEKLIVEAFNQDLAALQKKQFEKNSEKEYEKSLLDTKEYFNDQRDLEGQRYANGLSTKKQYDAELKNLDLSEKAQLAMVAQDYSATSKKADKDLFNFKKDLQKATTLNEIEQAELRKKTAQQEALAKAQLAVLAAPDGSKKRIDAQKKLLQLQFDQDTEGLDKKSELFLLKEAELQSALDQIDADAKQRRIQAIDEFAQNVLSITSTMMQALNNLDQRELQKDKALNEAKKNNYKRQLDSRLISQKQYDAKVAKADEELDKKKREMDLKAFKRQQALAIVGALINGAMAVTSTLAARPGLADIFSLGVARAIQVGLVVAATAAQVAAIATQAPPEMGDGGLIKNGPYHKDKEKGLHVVDPVTGKTEMLLEKDEGVVKGAAMRDKSTYTVTGTPSQIASKLNSMHGGVNWATGATIITPKFRERPAQLNPNLPRIMEQGGIVRPMNPVAQKESNNDELFREMIAKQEELITEVKNQKERLHAVVSIKEYREMEKKYDQAKKAGGMSQ